MERGKAIDLVWALNIHSGCHLVCAPAFSGLKKDDEVFIGDGDFPEHVVDVTTVYISDSIYSFVLNVARAEDPLPRIREKVTYIREEFHYPDQEEGATDG